VIGVPIGTFFLTYLDPSFIRTGVGVFLVLYSTYSLVRPVFRPVQAGQLTDATIGFFNGMLGGLAGLPGIIVTIWCQLRGWSKDEQRTVFQPVNLANILMSVVALSVAGTITADVVELYLLGLPLMLGGLWSGFKLYGHLDDAAFRKILLVLLLVSGLTLAVPISSFKLA
jgi:uncharacterized membrane protein YfcA